MKQLLTYSDIDPLQWQALIDRSPYATWFQTKEAYEFYASLPEEMTPFVYAVAEDSSSSYRLKALCVGYITKEKSAFKQFFTRRAIIIGGPLLAEDATAEEIAALLNAVKKLQRSDLQQSDLQGSARSILKPATSTTTVVGRKCFKMPASPTSHTMIFMCIAMLRTP